MGAFEYSALDDRGKTRRGVIESETARTAKADLRERGLYPLEIRGVADERDGNDRGSIFQRWQKLSPTEIALVTRQLATLVAAGMPIDSCLSAVIRQAGSHRIRKVMTVVRSRVLEGQTLAQGLAAFPRAFPDLYRSTVAAGEESGALDTVLERLADYTENRQATSQRIQLALFYPALLTVMAFAVVIGLVVYVVPQVVEVFVQMEQELPFLTRALIAVSDFLRAWWAWLLAGLVIGVVGFRLALRRPHLRYAWQSALLRFPLIGRLIRVQDSARFSRTLSILSVAGVPMLRSLAISAEVVGSAPMRETIRSAAERVRGGAAVAASLGESRLFPPMVIHLIAAGEQSGAVGEMLQRAAAQQERELETSINAFLGLFEPLLILLMGGIVLIIVLAILVPIFDLNQMV